MAAEVSAEGATVAAYDIARLASVGRAAVSNWRRRYADFPNPVGGSAASPLYSLNEMEEWLRRHGRAFEIEPADRLWQLARGAVDDMQLADLVSYTGALLILLQRAPGRWKPLAKSDDVTLSTVLSAEITKKAPDLPTALPQRVPQDWMPIVRLAADSVSRQDPAEIFDVMYERLMEVHGRRQVVTAPPVAEFLCKAVQVGSGSLLDPACGTGNVLLAGYRAGATGLRGQEINPTSAQLSAVRLMLHGAPVGVAVGDALVEDAFAGELADAVICDPPFAERAWGYDDLLNDPRWEFGLPPRAEPELAWVQHSLAHVKPGGCVAVVMPSAAAARRSGRRIRSNLLRSGALRAVISVSSGGSGAGPTTAADVWLLRRPNVQTSTMATVLLADGTSSLDDASRAWRDYLAHPGAIKSGNARVVRIIDLLDDEVDVSPQRQLSQSAHAEPAGADFAKTEAGMREMMTRLSEAVPHFDVMSTAPKPTSTTIGELVRAGVIEVLQAPLKAIGSDGPDPLLTARDVRHGRNASGFTTAERGAIRTQPGDVVLSVASSANHVRVIGAGGAVLGPQLSLFRMDRERVDPDFIAGYLRLALSRGARASTSSRTDLYRIPIPRIAVPDQRAIGHAFQALVDFEDRIHDAAAVAEEMIRLGFVGLADGSLQPSGALH